MTRDEIARGEKNEGHILRLAESRIAAPPVKTKRGPRYTPVSRRQDRPNAILWLLKSHPELKDSQIIRLIGTTKPTIGAIRDKTHWNSSGLAAQDPVTLSLCSQIDLDAEVKKAAARLERERRELQKSMAKAGTLLPTEETTAEPAPVVAEIVTEPVPEAPAPETEAEEAARVFQKLKSMKTEEPAAQE